MMGISSLNHKVVCLLFVGISLISNTLGTQSVSGKDTSELTEAYFDYFAYKGADSFYQENPLPGKEYFYNPILPGWHSDPSICSNGKDYFLVTSSFVYYPGVPIFHSRDLINWKQIGFVLDRPSQLINFEGQKTNQGIFAPAISYNPYNETYYLITTNVGAGNFFVKTKDPFGSWSEPVWVRDVHGIDPSFFFDDNGRAYILNNDEPEGAPRYEGHRSIRIREFDIDNEKSISPEKVLVDGGVRPEENPIWIEGPHLYKINGHYFLMAAEGGSGPMHSEVILKGDSPMGEFIPWEKNPILTQRHLSPERPNPITWAGHADLIKCNNGEWWSVFLACRPINNQFENLGRETFLMPVNWSENGFPYMTQGEDLIPMIVKKDDTQRNNEVTFGNFEKWYYFDSESLCLDWFTLRSSATDMYCLKQKPGYLTLRCTDVKTSEQKTPAFIARRLQHHQFECETKMLFEPLHENEAAGLLLYKDEQHQYFMAVILSDGIKKIRLEKISETGNEILSEQIIPNHKSISLKIISEGTHYNFYYSLEGTSHKLLAENISAYYLSTANSYGFTGTTIGMYATQKAN